MTFRLHGDANDYTGKGLSAAACWPSRRPRARTYRAEDNVVIGNTVLYGATSGRAFFRGLAGERFAVRNSGASAVVEGVGDHGCEYMTGGRVVVLGRTGRNFAAGMSGGLAFVLDEDGTFRSRLNPAMLDQVEALDEADAIEVRDLVAEHARRTGSPVAARVLDEWDELQRALREDLPDRLQARPARSREAAEGGRLADGPRPGGRGRGAARAPTSSPARASTSSASRRCARARASRTAWASSGPS